MAKLAKEQEQTQIHWGIELFRLFIIFAAQRGGVTSAEAQTLQKELQELAKAAEGEDPSEAIVEQLNHYISMVNTQLKQNTPPTAYAPFPPFSFIVEGHERSAVLDQIDMVERTLTEAAGAKILEWEKEGKYFEEILQIFAQVEKGSLAPQEAIAKIIGEIEKINQTLPEKYHLPIPDLSAYQ